MSLVDAARRLAASSMVSDCYHGCVICGADVPHECPDHPGGERHAASCPVPLLPQIVAVLEHYERLREDYTASHDELMKYRTSMKIGRERHQLLERIASRVFYGDDRSGMLNMEQLRAALRGDS